jgi:2-amino-4-hydroxy-6-hydroxymethyldihydropteridine diphosphokinase
MTKTNKEMAKVELKPITAYIGLGTNLGNREANLREAIERISRLGINVTGQSSIYETEPVGFKDQPWFLNQVIESVIFPEDDFGANTQTEASYQPELWLSALLRIEDEMGRERNIPNGPRVIDLDLLLFGDMIIARKQGQGGARYDLIVPHPRIRERRFVLEPLCEIAPSITWPQSDVKLADTLATLEDTSIVRLYSKVC